MNNTILIPLRNRNRDTVNHAIIDSDEAYLLKWRWSLTSTGYVRRGTKVNGKFKAVRLHRQIAKAPVGMDVDHINGDKLDNRKLNLRIVTRSQNLTNRKGAMPKSTSGIRGVSFDASRNKWVAHVKQYGKIAFRKRFNTKQEAENSAIEKRKQLGFLEGAAK